MENVSLCFYKEVGYTSDESQGHAGVSLRVASTRLESVGFALPFRRVQYFGFREF